MPPYITYHPHGVLVRLKVVPGASRDRVMGQLGDALKIAVSAPPESGKANDAVIALLAEILAVPKRSIAIVRGHTQPRKDVLIAGISTKHIEDQIARQG